MCIAAVCVPRLGQNQTTPICIAELLVLIHTRPRQLLLRYLLQLVAQECLVQFSMIVDDEHRQILVEHVERRVPDDRDDIEVERLPCSMAVDAVATRG